MNPTKMMPTSTTVTLAEVLPAVHGGYAMLAPESAGYLTLAVADAVVRRPVSLADEGIELSLDGSITLREHEPTTRLEAEAYTRALLARLLVRCAMPPPALRTIIQRAVAGDISALVEELEAALIPVNRGAAKRTLARLARETQRASLSRVELPSTDPPLASSDASDSAPDITDEILVPLEPSAPAPVVLPPVASTVFSVTPAPSVATPTPPLVTPTPTPTVRMESPFTDDRSPSRSRTDELLAAFPCPLALSDQQMVRELRTMAELDPSLTPPPVYPVIATESSSSLECSNMLNVAMPASCDQANVSPQWVAPEREHRPRAGVIGSLCVCGILAALWLWFRPF